MSRTLEIRMRDGALILEQPTAHSSIEKLRITPVADGGAYLLRKPDVDIPLLCDAQTTLLFITAELFD